MVLGRSTNLPTKSYLLWERKNSFSVSQVNKEFNKHFEPIKINTWCWSNRYESATNTGRSVADAAMQAIPVKTVARGKRCVDSPLVMQPQTEGRKNTRATTQFTATIPQFKLYCRHTNQRWSGLKESHRRASQLRRERCGQSDVLSVRHRQIWLGPVGPRDWIAFQWVILTSALSQKWNPNSLCATKETSPIFYGDSSSVMMVI